MLAGSPPVAEPASAGGTPVVTDARAGQRTSGLAASSLKKSRVRSRPLVAAEADEGVVTRVWWLRERAALVGVLEEFLVAVPDGDLADVRDVTHLALRDLLVREQARGVDGRGGEPDR